MSAATKILVFARRESTLLGTNPARTVRVAIHRPEDVTVPPATPNPGSAMSATEESITRRTALRLFAAALLLPFSARHALAYSPRPAPLRSASPRWRAVGHPTPRPGISGAAVLPPDQVPKKVRAAYEAARAVPEVLDGLHCYCDCAERDGLYSLLSCFETTMPFTCGFCSEEAVLAHRLARKKKTMDEIRAAIDAEFAQYAIG